MIEASRLTWAGLHKKAGRRAMASVNQTSGDDASNTLQDTRDADLICGFNPNGSTASVFTMAATRVVTGLSQPVAAVAAPGDSDHLFIVERTGAIQVLDLRSGTTGSFSMCPRP